MYIGVVTSTEYTDSNIVLSGLVGTAIRSLSKFHGLKNDFHVILYV